jgi:polysaccharide biosynthesis/export protein
MTMLTAVALAGGFIYRAITDYASDVRHKGEAGSHTVTSLIDPDSTLELGDAVTIFQRYF